MFSEGFSDDDLENILHSTVRPKSPVAQPTSSEERAFQEGVAGAGIPCTQSSVSAVQSEEEAFDDIVNETFPCPLDFSQLPLEVYPPAPEISTKAPGTLPSQVTTYLKTNTKRKPDIFKAVEILRPLRSDERGCWVVETREWTREAQYHFWTTLSQLLREGKLGWGLSLHREPKDSDRRYVGLGKVRLYCWGEVVEQIWEVLWTCSLGELSGSGSKWLDAEEIVVISVP
jgi:hypothetical protein